MEEGFASSVIANLELARKKRKRQRTSNAVPQNLPPTFHSAAAAASLGLPIDFPVSVNLHKNKKESTKRLSFGYFEGTTVFRNCLHPDEKLEDGHVTLSNLIPPNVERALITSFDVDKTGDTDWFLESIWGCGQKPSQVVIVHRGTQNIGQSKLEPMNRRQGWYFLPCKPHTGGCMHPKILLFGTEKGLRVIVSGNNFYRKQWEYDRDCLWVQDFAAHDNKVPLRLQEPDSFALKSFLSDLCQCSEDEAQDQFFLDQHLKVLFHRIDFSESKASFVYSFPRNKLEKAKDRGGHRLLCKIVEARMVADYDTDQENSDNSNKATSTRHFGGSVLYAMSGSYGDVEPVFLSAMKNAMSGRDTLFQNEALTWESLDGIQCLMPSLQTARIVHLGGRLMDRKHWFNNIPKNARKRLFNDTLPNPPTTKLLKYPFAHCKVMYYRPRNSQQTATLYVGSHNFSKAAWGIADKVSIYTP